MVDISDFLRGRGVPEDAIVLMEEQKIDCDVIALMDDATLANYIPSTETELPSSISAKASNHCQKEN